MPQDDWVGACEARVPEPEDALGGPRFPSDADLSLLPPGPSICLLMGQTSGMFDDLLSNGKKIYIAVVSYQ